MTKVNRDPLESPLLAPRVHPDGHGRARAECSQQQIVRRRAAVGSTRGCRFVGDELMRAGDDLLNNTSGCASYDDDAFGGFVVGHGP